MHTIKIETQSNGYKAEGIQHMIRKLEKAAELLFPGCTVRHFYYGDELDMVDVVLDKERYAHFNITASRVSLGGYECSSDDLIMFGRMTFNDECYEGNLLVLAAQADGLLRQKITPVEGKVYTNRCGYEYRCVRAYAGGDAIMENLKTGWTLHAHGVQQYEDGTIEWDYSTGGHFADHKERW